MTEETAGFGVLLRDWRRRRRRSQLDLSAAAEVSQRHLSFLESGRSRPSREMVARIAEALDLPLRAADELHLAAGFAPRRRARALSDPTLTPVLETARGIVAMADPAPGIVVDRRWSLVEANDAARRLFAAGDPGLMAGDANVLRFSLHPKGLGPLILNYREWRAHIAARLGRDAELSGDPALTELREELLRYPVPAGARPGPPPRPVSAPVVAIPLTLRTPAGVLNLLSATTIFGSAVDVLASELVIECFYPVAAEDQEILERLAS